MKKKILNFLILLLTLVMLIPETVFASDGTSYVYDGYIYDYWQNPKESPAAFQLEKVFDQSSTADVTISSIDDVCTSEDGRIFIVDSKESRVNVLDSSLNFITSLKAIRTTEGKIALDASGNQIVLSAPEGAFVHEKENELYIADTGNKRVIVLDLKDYTLKQIINAPSDMTGVTEFKPSKICVDLADRIYVVIQSSYEGIVELTRDGEFSGYYGVNTPRVNFVDYFWKSIATDEQKEKLSKTYAPAFNNITLDGEGFVMAVTYDSSADDMIFRLNSEGENVIREEGNTKLVGDLWKLDSDDSDSQFVDIAVTDYGTYAVLDKSKGRIFLYNFDGELLNAFGTLGSLTGEFKNPTSIAWLGNKLVVTDSGYNCLYLLQPTTFGEAILEGSESYYFGDWDEALVSFEKAVSINSNYEPAYSGIGKNYLMKEDYETAMYYFKMGNNRDFYSKAYEGYRSERLENHFGIIFAIMVLIIVLLIWTEVRYHKYGSKVVRDEEEAIKYISTGGWKSDLREKFYYVRRALFHPFDGFYEIRYRNQGSILIAVCSIIIFAIMCCVEFQYTGFIMNNHDISTMNSLSIMGSALLIFLLFIVSNWSVTTLLGGKGTIKHITIVCGYSFIPVIIAMLFRVIMSNFIIEEEAMIINVIYAIGIVWCVFLMLTGLTVVHEYSFTKMLACILLTAVAAVIIVFLCILFFTLIEQMVEFIVSVGKEFIRRL